MATILQIHASYRERGGEDAVVEAERRLLERAGHEVVSVVRENAQAGPRAAAQLAAYTWNPASARSIMKIAKKVRPEVIHAHNTWFSISPRVLVAMRSAGMRTIVTVHNYRFVCANAQLIRQGVPCELCVGSGPWAGIRHRCYRDSRAASAAAAIGIQTHRWLGTWKQGVSQYLALTSFSRDRLVAAGLPPGRVVVHPNFTIDPGPRSTPPSESRIVTYAGRLSPEKGLAILLEAWKRARPAGLRLEIAGEGPQVDYLQRRADESVRFLGVLNRDAVDQQLLRSRAVVLPSLCYEAQPLGALEALAAGTPVLGSAIGGLGETIAPLGERWQAAPGDVTAWSSALRRLSDDSLMDAGGKAARRLYEREHSPGIALNRLEHAYRVAHSGSTEAF